MSIRRMMLFTLGAKIKNLIQAFKERVLADFGLFEAESCLDTQLTQLDNQSVLDNASLIVTPNGYKETKLYSVVPNTTLGDMSVTRATTATRVNADGDIEQVPYNLFQRSEEFENAIWTKSNLSIIQNTQTSPIGNLTADTIRIGIDASSVRHRLNQQPVYSINTTYTTSYYLKKANHRWVQLIYVIDTVFGLNSWANFDLENGVIGNTGAGAIATIENVGNGWYRCSVQATSIVGGSSTGCEIVTTNNTNSGRYPSYQSTVAEDVCYIWGAQLVIGTQAKDYFPTTNRFNIPRIDYSNGSCPSILVEPQRTNTIRNSTMQGAVVGTPGTLPTNWAQGGAGGSSTTRTVIGTGIENGLTYIDIRYQGTVTGQLRLIQESGTTQPATVGTNITISYYIKLVSGTAPQGVQLVISNRNSLNTYISDNSSSYINLTNSLTRYTYSATISQIGTAFAQPLIQWLFPGSTYDFTIRVAAPQMEQGSNATSFIPTTTTTVTRNADIITNTNASTLIGQTEGVIYVQTSRQVITSIGGWIFRIDNNTENNRLGIFSLANTGNLAVNIARNGVSVDIINYSNFLSLTNQGNAKIALAYKDGDFALAVNGTIVGTSSNSGTIPFMNSCRSSTISEGLIPNQSINCISLFKTRLTNTQLQQLTTL